MVFYTLDTETTEWKKELAIHKHNNYKYQILKPKLFVIVKYDNNCNELDYKIYKSDNQIKLIIEYFQEQFIEEKSTLRIYSHNLDYDIKFLIANLSSAGYTLKPVRKSRLLSMKCSKISKNKDKTNKKDKNGKDRNTIYFDFRDSFALLPLSIKEIGKIVGLEKLEVSDYTTITQELITYCKRDNEIITKGLKALIELFSNFGYTTTIDELPLTIPALSLKLFFSQNTKYAIQKTTKNGQKIKKNQLFEVSPKMNAYFKQFYFGGRTEVFNLNIANDVNYYDINSLYPSVMMKNLFPIPPYYKSDKICELTFFVLAIIDESNELYPLIPERDIDSGKVIFSANSNKKHLLCIEEYYYLLERKCIKKIIEVWNCAEWSNPFKYMENIYAIRMQLKKEDNKLNELCKLPLNSTYGKFAQSTEVMEREILPLNKINSEELFTKLLSNKIQFIDSESKTYEFTTPKTKSIQLDYINTAFAVRITALSRLCITKYIHVLQQNGITFYYCDTDSLVSDKSSEKVLKLSKELGFFKIEKTFDKFFAFSPKEYVYEETIEEMAGMNLLNEKTKIKGLKSDSSIQKYMNEGIENIRPAKIFECWIRKIPLTSAIVVNKQKQTYYNKRFVNPDGTTKPIKSTKHLDVIQNHNRKIIKNQMRKWIQISDTTVKV